MQVWTQDNRDYVETGTKCEASTTAAWQKWAPGTSAWATYSVVAVVDNPSVALLVPNWQPPSDSSGSVSRTNDAHGKPMDREAPRSSTASSRSSGTSASSGASAAADCDSLLESLSVRDIDNNRWALWTDRSGVKKEKRKKQERQRPLCLFVCFFGGGSSL